VLDGRHIRHGLRAIGTIQVVAQDRGDGAVDARTDIDSALTRSLDTLDAVAAYQAEDAEAGTESGSSGHHHLGPLSAFHHPISR
jgi:hypothetical protein